MLGCYKAHHNTLQYNVVQRHLQRGRQAGATHKTPGTSADCSTRWAQRTTESVPDPISRVLRITILRYFACCRSIPTGHCESAVAKLAAGARHLRPAVETATNHFSCGLKSSCILAAPYSRCHRIATGTILQCPQYSSCQRILAVTEC